MVFERLARPRLHQQVERLVHDLAATTPLLVHRRVLERPVPQTHRHHDASLPDEIEHGKILGDPDRIVEREQERADHAQHVFGSRQDHASTHHRGR